MIHSSIIEGRRLTVIRGSCSVVEWSQGLVVHSPCGQWSPGVWSWCTFYIKRRMTHHFLSMKVSLAISRSTRSSFLIPAEWGLCALRHGIQISMEAILACHPARSTEWLGCHPKSCELWRIRTGPISWGRLAATADLCLAASAAFRSLLRDW